MTNCKATILSGPANLLPRCSRAAVRDGYCRQHHPDAVLAREEKRRAFVNAKDKSIDDQARRAAMSRDAIEIVREIERQATKCPTAVEWIVSLAPFRAFAAKYPEGT